MAFPAGYFLLACQSRDAQTQVVRLDRSMRIPLVNGVTGAERACPRRQLQTHLISTGVSAPARSGAWPLVRAARTSLKDRVAPVRGSRHEGAWSHWPRRGVSHFLRSSRAVPGVP